MQDDDQTQLNNDEPVAQTEETPAAEGEPRSDERVETTPNDEVVASEAVEPAEEAVVADAPEVNEPVSEEASEPLEENQPSEESSEVTEPETETTEAEESTEEPVEEPVQNTNPDAKWYVVHTYSGHENKVAATLKQRVEAEHLEERIIDVLVPTQDKIEIKGGKKTEVKEKIFPGYILVKMVLDDNTWLAVRTTQGVTSFVGIGNKPTPIPESEVQSIVKFTQIQQPTFKQVFSVNDTVKIVDGPFAEFIGKIDSVDEEKGKVRVLVSIFGRETPVELDFLQVQKI